MRKGKGRYLWAKALMTATPVGAVSPLGASCFLPSSIFPPGVKILSKSSWTCDGDAFCAMPFLKASYLEVVMASTFIVFGGRPSPLGGCLPGGAYSCDVKSEPLRQGM